MNMETPFGPQVMGEEKEKLVVAAEHNIIGDGISKLHKEGDTWYVGPLTMDEYEDVLKEEKNQRYH